MKEINRVEPRLTSYLYSKAYQRNIPLSLTFELSPVCNFSCRMCYVRKTAKEVREHNRPILTKEQWLQIAREAKKQGTLFLLLTGGEPFLWPDFFDLYEELVQMGFLISINTNASLINDQVIERLKKYPPLRINITLYGASDDTYEALCGVRGIFSRVDYAITELQKAGILVKLNGSLTPYNIADLEDCVKYADDHNLIYETVTYMFPPVRRNSEMAGVNERFTPEEAARYNAKAFRLIYGEENYWDRMKAIVEGIIPPPGLDEGCIDPLDGKVRCRAGSASGWITWDGYLTPCGMMPKPTVELVSRSFIEAWDELGQVTGNLKLSGICQKCTNQKLCHSCAAMAISETGDVSGVPTYLCKMVEEMKKYAIEELKNFSENK